VSEYIANKTYAANKEHGCNELQGDMVNNIENNVSNAAEYIYRAKEETKKAVRYQKKSRRVSAPLQ